MNDVTRTVKDLVIANRILAHEGIVDAFGDVSVRHPADKTRFFLARAVSPGVVAVADIIEFGLDGTSLDGTSLDGTPRNSNAEDLPGERFIHAAIYEARPDLKAVLHASPEDILPFGITRTPLRPVIASVGDMGLTVPVWDIADKFGGSTELKVSTLEQGRDLARCLGSNRVVLIRGEGFVVTGRTLNDVVRLSAISRATAAPSWRRRRSVPRSGSRRARWRRALRSTRNRTRCAAAGSLGPPGRLR